MSTPGRSNRHHLRSVPTESPAVINLARRRAPSPADLDARVVAAALDWAAEVLSSPLELDDRTPEGRARLRLLDAVHDREYHAAYPTHRLDAPH